MKHLLLLAFVFSIGSLSYAQGYRNPKVLPYQSADKPLFFGIKGGLNSTQFRFNEGSTYWDIEPIEVYGTLFIEHPFRNNKSIEAGLTFSYYTNEHFVEMPLLFKFFLSKRFATTIGIQPSLYLDELVEECHGCPEFDEVDNFGFAARLGGQYYLSKHVFIEGYYARDFVSQFNEPAFDSTNGKRDVIRLGGGVVF